MCYDYFVIKNNKGETPMKPAFFTFGLIATLCGGNAMADDFTYAANGVAAYNIMAMQHNIVNRAIILPTRRDAKKTENNAVDAEQYGEMLYYGEYGDDTGVLPLTGRNGGDVSNAYIGADWQHIDENVKFKSHPHMDATMDLAMIEFGNNFETMYGRPLDLKFFGGYVGGDIKNQELRISQGGGFIGIFAHRTVDNFDINAVGNFGLMINNVRKLPTTDEFNNIWVSVNMDVAYNFAIDEYIVLKPNVRGGYTWIYSPNYELKNGQNINNKNFSVFELTPAIDANINVGDGWTIGARGAYVMNFVDGGETYVEYSKISSIESKDYFEYGIKIEKSVDDLNFGINVGRHDGGRTGWFGGATIKYLF